MARLIGRYGFPYSFEDNQAAIAWFEFYLYDPVEPKQDLEVIYLSERT